MENRSSLRRFVIVFVMLAALLLSASCKAKGPEQIKSTASLTTADIGRGAGVGRYGENNAVSVSRILVKKNDYGEAVRILREE